MIRFLFLLLFVKSMGFACTLCTVFSPKTSVQIYVDSTKDTINNVKFIWVLNKQFTESLKDVYDTNSDGMIDKQELILVEEAFLDYAMQNDFSTHISYDVVVNKKQSKKIEAISSRTYIKESALHFEYILKLDYKIKKEYFLYIRVLDEKRFFLLSLDKAAIYFENENSIQRLIYKQSVIFVFNSVPFNQIKQSEEPKIKEIRKTASPKEKTLLESFVQKVKKHLLSIKEDGNILALFSLLFVSFIYGIVHAIGPGHGKSLAFSYFSTHKSSYFKAFVICQASAFIHIVGAFIMVLISVFVLETFLNNFVTNSVLILTKTSAVMIVLLASYIFYKKLKNKSCSCCQSTISTLWRVNTDVNHKLKPIKTDKKEYKKDIYFVLTAGLIPCPGTVVLFIYAFILKTYMAVVLASIFISLGMGLIIFLAAFLGVGLRQQSQKSKYFSNLLEYTAIAVMFILGILLFFNANLI